MRKFYWFLFTPGVLLLLLAAIHFDNPGLVRIAKLTIWVEGGFCLLVFPLSVLAACIDSKKFPGDMKLRTVPGWVQIPFDLAIIGACAYQGWVFTGVIAACDLIVGSIAIAFLEQAAKENKKPTTP